ncbi:protease III [Alteromonadales bacterium TW-7]|nr:protease III [Alteromonadales bacterium TW-7]
MSDSNEACGEVATDEDVFEQPLRTASAMALRQIIFFILFPLKA